MSDHVHTEPGAGKGVPESHSDRRWGRRTQGSEWLRSQDMKEDHRVAAPLGEGTFLLQEGRGGREIEGERDTDR